MVCRKGRQGMWLPGKGLISWTRAMGHAPGSLMLQYGNYILAGDVFGQMRTPWYATPLLGLRQVCEYPLLSPCGSIQILPVLHVVMDSLAPVLVH